MTDPVRHLFDISRSCRRAYLVICSAVPKLKEEKIGAMSGPSKAIGNVLDRYITSAPSHQNALDIFEGQWTSLLPGSGQGLTAGSIPLFEDPRAAWAIEKLGGVQDKTVLELGPLEGGHSYMLQSAGAMSVLAVESNTNAFLRCLIVKEILDLKNVRFLHGDFRAFLVSDEQQFDVIFASGVLYHMTEPVQLLRDISRRCRSAYLWTHYHDSALIEQNQAISNRFGPAQHLEYDGLKYELHAYSYDVDLGLNWAGFCGGSTPSCAWLTRQSILDALAHFGFKNVDIAFEVPDHPHGPCFAIVASQD